jgi:hypothetical protein
LTNISDGGTSIDGESIRHSYDNYCREFKNLFYAADKEENGELWKYVTLFNPWNFYAFSKNKIDEIHSELSNKTNGGITI